MTATIAAGLATLTMLWPTAAASDGDATLPGAVVVQDALRDLQPGEDGPMDGAKALLVMVSAGGGTTVVLQVLGADPAVAGRRFGAHLHVGPCVTGDGAAAGPHYNADVAAGHTPPQVDDTTEVWLDFTVTALGTGTAVAHVPFVPEPGDRAVVVHRDPTDHHGTAGPRLACLPVAW